MTRDAHDLAGPLPPDLQRMLGDLLAALAENKQVLGLRYSQWCSSGPTLEAAVAATAMAQDELGHARVLLGLLDEVRGEASREDSGWETAGYHLAALDDPFGSWADFVAANALLDPALTVLVDAATASRYAPLRQRARKMVEEERFHAMHGRTWFRRIAQSGTPMRVALGSAAARMLPEALCWFGPDGSLAALVERGILEAGDGALRHNYLAQVIPMLREARFPAPAREQGGGWVLEDPLPWKRWDPRRRRLNRSAP